MRQERRVVLIAGPTASGKSALALAIAIHCGAAVVNADSMQVYRELRLLTARPNEAEEAAVPHRLYGHVSAAEGYTVARWLKDIAAVLQELSEANMPAVIVGGTGLYFTALTEGLSEIPPISTAVRAHWRAEAENRPAGALHALLESRDPVMAARLRPSDSQRILRALEVIEGTGRSLAEWQQARGPALIDPSQAAALVLAPERRWLHAQIARRFESIMDKGGVEEARALAARRLDPTLPALKAIGVPEMIALARGEMEAGEARAAAIAATRRYAKRQETWFRNQMPAWRRVHPEAGNFLAIAEEISQRMK